MASAKIVGNRNNKKAFNTEELEVENFHNLSAKNFRSFIRVSSTTAKTSPILEFIAVIAMVSVLYVSLIQVKDGLVSGAVVLSFFSVVAFYRNQHPS